MNDALKWIGKIGLHAVFWIFVLSIRWDGRTLFSYGNDTLVQNSFVQAFDEELADLWSRLSQTAKVTFNQQDVTEEDQVF